MNYFNRQKPALMRAEINAMRGQLRQWYTHPLGVMLHQLEDEQLEPVLANLFGYHVLQVGYLLPEDLLESSRIRHRVIIDPDPEQEGKLTNLYAYPDSLPILSHSVDVVLLPHTLEFERDPHQILREVDRVLIPEGHIVILGFNPWSLWGLWRFILRRRQGSIPWCARFLSLTRAKDWLALLGFDVVLVKQFFFRPPVRHEGVMRRLNFLEKLGARWWPGLAGAYMLVAKKRVTTLTPIRPRWKPRRSLVGKLVNTPTQKVEHDQAS